MVPFTLSQPPETTIAISLFGADLIRIMAKESERCCTYLAMAMLIDHLVGVELIRIMAKESEINTWQWQCWFFEGSPCDRPSLADLHSSPAGLHITNLSKYIRHLPKSEVDGDVEQWPPILEVSQRRKRRGTRIRMRRGARVTRPTILFQSRGKALPEKGAILVFAISH